MDVVLTREGRRQLSRGRLDVTYYVLFDDEIDYDPYISDSGSMSSAILSASIDDHIQMTPVIEAVCGTQHGEDYRFDGALGVRDVLFTMNQGQKLVPRMVMSPDLMAVDVSASQWRREDVIIRRDQNGRVVEQLGSFDGGFESFDPGVLTFDLSIGDGVRDGSGDGFVVRVFKTGSDGLEEVASRLDSRFEESYGTDLLLRVDSHFPISSGSVGL